MSESSSGAARPWDESAPSLLHLAADLHTAKGNPTLWRGALAAIRDHLSCKGVLDLAADAPISPDDLAALAGRVTHCAAYGKDCGHKATSHHADCACFAIHMHTAAYAARKTLQAGLFEQLAPTWVVDRSAKLQEANQSARALTHAGEHVIIVENQLELVGAGGGWALKNALLKLSKSTHLLWHNKCGKAMTFLLRELQDTTYVAVTALLDAPPPQVQAQLLAEQLSITRRQSELAAHLLADHSVADAARAMGISRHTANEHLVALQQSTGCENRKTLLALLRRVSQS